MGARVRILGFSVSRDGYGAGPHQSEREPPGEGGSEGVDDAHVRRDVHALAFTDWGRRRGTRTVA